MRHRALEVTFTALTVHDVAPKSGLCREDTASITHHVNWMHTSAGRGTSGFSASPR